MKVFHRNLRFWLKISICQSSMVQDGCWVNCPTRVGNLEVIDNLLKRIRKTDTSGYYAAADCVQRVAVVDLVLSQEDKPKRHRSAREISHETAILHSSVHRIIYHNPHLKCFKRRRAQLLSEAWVPQLTPGCPNFSPESWLHIPSRRSGERPRW